MRLFYPQAKYNIQWHPALLFIANAALANSNNDPEWQFYFMAALYGYGVLAPAYRVAELCFKGLLTFAMETKKIPAGKAQYLLQELSQRREHYHESDTHSAIRLNLSSGASNENSGTVEDLASRFELIAMRETDNTAVNNDSSLFDELINLPEDET